VGVGGRKNTSYPAAIDIETRSFKETFKFLKKKSIVLIRLYNSNICMHDS